MFKDLLNVFHRGGLLKLALEDTFKMMELSREIFTKSVKFFSEKGDVKKIYDMDRQINELQIVVRRRVLEHLAINPSIDVTASLILITIVIDIERIGDYAKNIIEMADMYPHKLTNKLFDYIWKEEKTITALFPRTIKAFKAANADDAVEIMKKLTTVSKNMDGFILELVNIPDITLKDGIIAALLGRYIKRVAAHMKNIVSSVVNPFDRIGYKPQTA